MQQKEQNQNQIIQKETSKNLMHACKKKDKPSNKQQQQKKKKDNSTSVCLRR